MDRPFPAYEGNEPYIFVSYAHNDARQVYSELSWLHDLGFNLWYDEGIEAGTEWREELGHAIKGSGVFLYFVTPQSQGSENCRKELNFAVDEQIPVIAVHLSPTELSDGLKLTLSDRQAILKHDISAPTYQEKLQTRLATYLDSPIGVVTGIPKKSDTRFLAIAIGAFALLTVGLVFYTQQEFSESTQETKPASTAEEIQTPPVDLDEQSPSIAVLPFVNMSNDPEQEYFSDGITEDIINELARNTSLTVRPRSSAFALKGASLDLQAIGQRLNVTHILEGSVRRSGERLRVTVQLSEVEGNRAIWSDRYDRELTDVFAVQDEITEDVVNSLGARFERRTSPRQFVSNESYEAFLLGRYHLNSGEYNGAVHWLKVATDLDSTNTDAWASRASVQSYQMFTNRLPTSEENLSELFEFTGQALAIDPNHSSALSSNALWGFIVHRDYQASIEQLIEIVRENPNDTDAHLHLAFCLRGIRQYPVAERVALRAQEIDPLSILTTGTLLDIYNLAGDTKKARRLISVYYERHPGVNAVVEQYAFHVAIAEGNMIAMEASLGSSVGHPSYPVNSALDVLTHRQHDDSIGFLRLDDSFHVIESTGVNNDLGTWGTVF